MVKRWLHSLEIASPKSLSILLFLIGFITYIPSLFNGFVWDDSTQIIENALIQSPANLLHIFQGGTFYGGAGVGLIGYYYKPLMPLVFMILYMFFGPNAFFYHLFDIVLHCIDGILIFFFFRMVFGHVHFSFRQVISFVLAFIFLIHPVNIESVASVASTQELLYVFFVLISLFIVFSLKKRFSFKKILLLGIMLLAALLSKETGALAFPLVFFLLFILKVEKKKYSIATLVIVGVLYLYLRFGVAHVGISTGSPLVPIQFASFGERLMTMPYEIFSYIRLVFFPKDLFIEQDEVITSLSDPRFSMLLPIVVAAIAAIGISFWKVKNAFFRFFIVWFVFGFLPVLNIIPVDMTIAERWVYGPLIGILGCLGFVLEYMLRRYQIFGKILVITLLILTPLYIFRDYTREFIWHDDMTLFSHDIKHEHSSARLYNDYGLVLGQAGRTMEAEKYFRMSIALNPYQFQAYNNLGILYLGRGNITASKLAFLLAIDHGALVSTYANYASILVEHKDYIQAVAFIERKGLFMFPQSPDLYQLLATAYTHLGQKAKASHAQQQANALNAMGVPKAVTNYTAL